MAKTVDPLQEPHVQMDPAARKVTLQDWNPEISDSIDVALSAVTESIDITFPDGRMVSLELESGDIRIHAFNRACEAPLSLRLPETGEISVDRQGYDLADKFLDEDLEAPEGP